MHRNRTRDRGMSAGESSRILPLSNFLPGVLYDIDATILQSYDGSSQFLRNLTAAPADGSPRGTYDFTLGNNSAPFTNDPTFFGSPGSPEAGFTNDAGDFFQIYDGSGGNNSAFLRDMHKTVGFPGAWTMITAIQSVDQTTSVTPFSTQGASTTDGLRLNIDSGERLAIFQGAGGVAKASANRPQLIIGTDSLIIFSYDGATLRMWLNSDTMTTNAYTFNATSADASLAHRIFGALGSGSKWYASALTNTYFSDAEAAIARAVYKNRHAKPYGG